MLQSLTMWGVELARGLSTDMRNNTSFNEIVVFIKDDTHFYTRL